MPNSPQSLMERHLQTVLMFVATGLIGWVGFNVQRQTVEIALLQQSVANLKVQVADFTAKPRFTKENFDLEMREYDARLSNLDFEMRLDDGAAVPSGQRNFFWRAIGY